MPAKINVGAGYSQAVLNSELARGLAKTGVAADPAQALFGAMAVDQATGDSGHGYLDRLEIRQGVQRAQSRRQPNLGNVNRSGSVQGTRYWVATAARAFDAHLADLPVDYVNFNNFLKVARQSDVFPGNGYLSAGELDSAAKQWRKEVIQREALADAGFTSSKVTIDGKQVSVYSERMVAEVEVFDDSVFFSWNGHVHSDQNQRQTIKIGTHSFTVQARKESPTDVSARLSEKLEAKGLTPSWTYNSFTHRHASLEIPLAQVRALLDS